MAKYALTGWPAVIPRVAVDDPKAVVEFIRDVFGAEGEYLPARPSELRIDDSLIMVGSTIERDKTLVFLYVYVRDSDAVCRRTAQLGAESLEKPEDMPYGDRRAMIRDPWGNQWRIATRGGRFAP